MENTLLADSGREKHLSFNQNQWFWGPIKHPFLKQNAIIFPLYKIKYPFCESEINCVSHFFPCTSYFSLRLIWSEYLNTRPRSNVWKPEREQAETCKMFTLFQNFADLSIFLDFPPTFEKLPFYAKVGSSMVYVSIGNGGRYLGPRHGSSVLRKRHSTS